MKRKENVHMHVHVHKCVLSLKDEDSLQNLFRKNWKCPLCVIYNSECDLIIL
jgi:hypothetical protein